MARTKDEMRKLIPVMEAWVRGEEIQVKMAEKWEASCNPHWVERFSYRIKPAPNIVWIKGIGETVTSIYSGEDIDEKSAISKGFVKYVEVV